MKISPEQFSAICFLVLMDHHGGGYTKAHPDYIEEKRILLSSGYDAFGFLDSENQVGVIIHIVKWGYKVPEEIKK